MRQLRSIAVWCLVGSLGMCARTAAAYPSHCCPSYCSSWDWCSSDEDLRDKLTKLEQLKRALGRAGVLALRPLMMSTAKDIWALTLLRR